MIPRFQIGDQAWRATFDSTPAFVECPDCCGSGRLRVIMGDDTEVSIDCQNCKRGYLGPQGVLQVYDRTPRAEPVIVTGMEMDAERIRYRTSTSYLVDDADLFADEQQAVARAQEIGEQFGAEERARIANKEKDTRSWAWNASYHRKAIKEAQRQIDYHTSKLAVASLKAKEAK